jgi:hypothetical protein
MSVSKKRAERVREEGAASAYSALMPFASAILL